MLRISLLFFFLSPHLYSLGVTTSENYVRIIRPIDGSTSILPFDYDFSNISVSYFDGLGRKMADVDVTASAADFDLVRFYEYDKLGRLSKTYLPFVSGDVTGSLPAFNLSDIQSYYNDNQPFSSVSYQNMSDRPTCEAGPGKLWNENGKVVKHDYRFNEENKSQYSCVLYDIIDNKLINTGMYKTAMLYVEVVTNEDGDSIATFKDKADRTVLVRKFLSNAEFADTYYVYENTGYLRYVISPEGATRLSVRGVCDNDVIEKYCYSYFYDSRNRIVEKRLPGAGVTFFVYDKIGNIVMTQSPSQRSSNEWTVTKYDFKNRPAVMGEVKTVLSRSELQVAFGDTLLQEKHDSSILMETRLQYTDHNQLPGFKPRMAWYYDDYSHWGNEHPELWQKDKINRYLSISAMGIQTGTAMMLESGDCIVTISVKDRKGNEVFTADREVYYNSFIYSAYRTFDFQGNMTNEYRESRLLAEGTTQAIYPDELNYHYDRFGRLMSVSHAYNAGPKTVIERNRYDDLGRVINQKYGNVNKNINYNIRNWVTEISTNSFTQSISYAEPSLLNSQYSGAPAKIINTYSAGSPLTINNEYIYDHIGRLTNVFSDIDAYNERFDYDLNGNITSLIRGSNLSNQYDVLSFNYDGNKMTEVTDNAAPSVFIQFPQLHTGTFELKYDSCGRLITDETRDITSISYDRNNNAKLINYNGGLIRATYRPDGVKMFQSTQEALSSSGISPAYIDTEDIDSKIAPLANRPSKYKYTTRYWYGPVYIESDKYPRIYFDTGYAEIKGDSVQYYYFVKDYLGSIVTITDKNGSILQTNRYLSGGLPQTAMTVNDRFIDNHLYCSMQYTGTHSMGFYDNTARIYDAILTRFTTQDPLSEKYPDISPYASRANNPMKYVDRDGRKFIIVDNIAQEALLNTLPDEDKPFVQFYEDGTINSNLLLLHKSDSYNYQCLGEIEKAQDIVTVEMNDHYNYKNNSGRELTSDIMDYNIENDYIETEITSAYSNTTGETGKLGIALLPGLGLSNVNSVDYKIHVVLNDKLSKEGAAANISHEVFGHSLLYIRTHNRYQSGHIAPEFVDLNYKLVNLIYRSLKETINNIRKNE